MKPKARYRAIFISDVHLGTRGCKADFLLSFLKRTDAETLYLVGDIIDLWKLRGGLYWPDAHNSIIRRLMKIANSGRRVVFIPGNHDEHFRHFLNTHFGGIEIRGHAVHELADSRRFIVFHGDQFDAIIVKHRWLAILGAYAYDFLLGLNTFVNSIRKRAGLDYWSLSGYLKMQAKEAVKVIGNFEHAVARAAEIKGFDGVVCGHIHKAEIRNIGSVVYCNAGDWVESCTALVEHFDGKLEIIDWVHRKALGEPDAAFEDDEEPNLPQLESADWLGISACAS
jgi:UDP-2,3-diacylglucosamine pyrophosphatase LpxH